MSIACNGNLLGRMRVSLSMASKWHQKLFGKFLFFLKSIWGIFPGFQTSYLNISYDADASFAPTPLTKDHQETILWNQRMWYQIMIIIKWCDIWYWQKSRAQVALHLYHSFKQHGNPLSLSAFFLDSIDTSASVAALHRLETGTKMGKSALAMFLFVSQLHKSVPTP